MTVRITVGFLLTWIIEGRCPGRSVMMGVGTSEAIRARGLNCSPGFARRCDALPRRSYLNVWRYRSDAPAQIFVAAMPLRRAPRTPSRSAIIRPGLSRP